MSEIQFLKVSKAERSDPCISPGMYDKLDNLKALTVWKVTKNNPVYIIQC